MILTLLLASTCVATATSHLPELKKDFEEKACSGDGAIKADLKSSKDLLENVMTIDVARDTLEPSPEKTVRAADTAQTVLSYVHKVFSYYPQTFQWTINDKNNKYICTVRVEDGEEVSGDCGGVGRQ